MSGPFVYAIRAGDTLHTKIGTAVDPWKRRKELQTGNPHDLHIIGLVEGELELEATLHKAMARFHMRGEWFDDRDGQIKAFFADRVLSPGIERIRMGSQDFYVLAKTQPHVDKRKRRVFYSPTLRPDQISRYKTMIRKGLDSRDVSEVMKYLSVPQTHAFALISDRDKYVDEIRVKEAADAYYAERMKTFKSAYQLWEEEKQRNQGATQ